MEPPARPAGDPEFQAPGTPYDRFARVLEQAAREGRSGVLLVAGEPGGLVHVARGRIAAVQTSGAPGPEVVLLRSGRVAEADWAAAFSVAAEGQLGAELVRRGLIGAARLEATLRLAAADAMFALACSELGACEFTTAPDPCLLPLDPGLAAGWLLAETARRLELLAAAHCSIGYSRDRVIPGPLAQVSTTRLDDGQQEILQLANGRRTARDMAFATGRGTFALTREFARMQDSGLLVVDSHRGVRPARRAAAGAHPKALPKRGGPARPDPKALPKRGAPGRPAPRAGRDDGRADLWALLEPPPAPDQPPPRDRRPGPALLRRLRNGFAAPPDADGRGGQDGQQP